MAVLGIVVAGPWLVTTLRHGVARLSRSLPGRSSWGSFGAVAIVGVATVALAYFGSVTAVAGRSDCNVCAKPILWSLYAVENAVPAGMSLVATSA